MSMKQGKSPGIRGLGAAGEALAKNIAAQLRERGAERVLRPVAAGIAALLLSGTEAAMGTVPFGVAMLCAARGLTESAAVFCGAVIGASGIAGIGVWQVLILMAAFAARLVFSSTESFQRRELHLESSFCENRIIRLMVSVGAAVGAGAVTVLGGSNLYYDVTAAALGCALYPLFTISFILFSSRSAQAEERLTGLCGVMLAVTAALHSLALPFDLGSVFAFAATLVITYKNGVTAGAAAGIFCGIAMETAYAPLYPAAALVSGLIFRYGSTTATAAALAAGIFWAVRAGGFAAVSGLLPELIFSAAVMIPLLRTGIIKSGELFAARDMQMPKTAELKGAELEKRMGRLSFSLEALSKLLYSVSEKLQRPSEGEAYRICTAQRARFCPSCPQREICEGTEAAETQTFFDAMACRLSAVGSVSAKVMPESVARRCHNADGILDAVNASARKVCRFTASSDKTELFASDYMAVAGMLRETAQPDIKEWARDTGSEEALAQRLEQRGVLYGASSVYGTRNRRVYLRGLGFPSAAGERDIRRTAEKVLGCRLTPPEFSVDGSRVSVSMRTAPAIRVESGRYSSGSKKEKISGDTICSFENDEGYYYTLVSDGMGSGREAAITSGLSSVFLEKLLAAGCPMKSALELLNCFIRGGEGECFATVDLMETDLYRSRASFIKSGAAPSFVLRDGRMFRLHSKTVPVGIIRAVDAELISFDLHDGDTVIMMSDGVTGSYEDCPWLYELLQQPATSAATPQRAAELIGEQALRKTDGCDDITVCVMKIIAIGESE